MIRLATEMTAEAGPESVSLREVARRAGVSSSAAYRHFSSKDELGEAVRRSILEALAERMARELAAAGSGEPRERLRAAGRAYVAFALESPLLFRGMSSGFEAPEGDWEGTPLGDLVGLVRDALPEAPEEVVTAQTIALWSLVHGFAILCTQGALRDRSPERRHELLENALTLGLRGLHAR